MNLEPTSEGPERGRGRLQVFRDAIHSVTAADLQKLVDESDSTSLAERQESKAFFDKPYIENFLASEPDATDDPLAEMVTVTAEQRRRTRSLQKELLTSGDVAKILSELQDIEGRRADWTTESTPEPGESDRP